MASFVEEATGLWDGLVSATSGASDLQRKRMLVLQLHVEELKRLRRLVVPRLFLPLLDDRSGCEEGGRRR